MKRLMCLIPLLFTCVFFIHEDGLASEDCGFPFAMAGEINLSYDDFRGIPDGSWNGNTGGLIGANFDVLLDSGFGIQAGGSYGVYDWYGRGPVGSGSSSSVQQQAFLTGGVFYKTLCMSGFQAGAVIDWMFNKNFGVFGLDPSFGQARLQAGYLFNQSDEIGLWGTVNIRTAHKDTFEIPVSFRAIGQVNLFWRHLFDNCAETLVWAGIPYRKSLMFSGKRAGTFTVGASFRVPLTSALSLEGHGMYMGAQRNHAIARFQNYGANICIGLTYAFGTGSNDCCASSQLRPYMPIANNSNFLVDASLND